MALPLQRRKKSITCNCGNGLHRSLTRVGVLAIPASGKLYRPKIVMIRGAPVSSTDSSKRETGSHPLTKTTQVPSMVPTWITKRRRAMSLTTSSSRIAWRRLRGPQSACKRLSQSNLWSNSKTLDQRPTKILKSSAGRAIRANRAREASSESRTRLRK